jgi:dTDP-4-dehydrorhamnose 3,5-epimerase
VGKFKFTETGIADLYIIEPTVFGDNRGYFMETYNGEFEPYIKHIDGSPAVFVQDNQSKSKRGVLRGLHFQKTQPQGKLVRALQGEIFDVAVDLRKKSTTFGKWYGIKLTGENKKMFYIPEGFAHGFVVLSETAEFSYKCTRYYDSSDEGGLLWNDETVGIDWGLPLGFEVVLSEKDKVNDIFENVFCFI